MDEWSARSSGCEVVIKGEPLHGFTPRIEIEIPAEKARALGIALIEAAAGSGSDD